MAEQSRRTSDTGALSFEELTDRQKQALKELRDILRRMASDGARVRRPLNEDKEPAGPPAPWLVSDQRESRVLLLSGGRGTGKTSVLLTLAQACHPDPEERETVHVPKELDVPERSIRFLTPIDLDPVPEGLPMIGWILQAFAPLVTWLDGQEGALCERQDRSRDRTAAGKPTLSEQFRDLQRVAVRGWDWGRRSHDGRGQLDWTLDMQHQVGDWAKLEDKWRLFVRELFCSERLVKYLSRDGLLVLMLDDPDLYGERSVDLIQALRRLWHPQIVFLLAADRDQLLDELTLDLARRQNKGLDGQADVKAWLEQEQWTKTPRALASKILEKVLPRQNRVDLGRTGLYGLLSFAGGKQPSLLTLLNAVSIPGAGKLGKTHNATLGSLLKRMADSFPGAFRDDNMSLRTWTQLREALGDIVNGSEDDRMIPVLHALLGAVERDDVEVEAHNRGKQDNDLLLRLHGASATPGYSERIEVASWAAPLPSSLWVSRADRLIRADGEGMGQPPHPLVLLAAETARRLPRNIRIEGPTPLVVGPWTWFVHQRTLLEGGIADLPWPWVTPETLDELLWWIEKARSLDTQAPQSRLDVAAWLRRWIRLNLEAVGARTPPNATDNWGDFVECLNTCPDPRLKRWVTEGLMVLAAPEGALPEDQASQLLGLYESLVNSSADPPWPALHKLETLRAAREQRVTRALAGAGRPLANRPRSDQVSAVMAMADSTQNHPWNVELRAQAGWRWWLNSLVSTGAGPNVLENVLKKREYIPRASGSEQAPLRNLRELFWSDAQGNQVTASWSDWLRPTVGGAASRLGELIRIVSGFARWNETSAALPLKQLYNWVIEQVNAPLDWQDWVTLDRAGTDLELSQRPRLRFRPELADDALELDQVILSHTMTNPWTVSGLPAGAWRPSPVARHALIAMLAIIQSFAADRLGSARWTVELPPLLRVRIPNEPEAFAPIPPLQAWIDLENLRLTMLGAWEFLRTEVGDDPPSARIRWLFLVWVETCCDLLEGDMIRGPQVDGNGRPTRRYPIEDLTPLRRAASRLGALAQAGTSPEIKTWATQTNALVSRALDAEARATWDAGENATALATLSYVLTAVNTGSTPEIRDAEIPFIGPEVAKRVAAHVRRNGPLTSLEELLEVRGIGEGALERIRAFDLELSRNQDSS